VRAEGVSSLRTVGRLALIALALLGVAGCSEGRETESARERPPPASLRPPTVPPKPKLSFVHVIVRDGDLGSPVRGAVVSLAGRRGRTDRDGVARIKIGRHVRLPVTVVRRGYDPFRQRLQFRGKPKVGVRVFQAKLQWPRYGATPGRTQSHSFIHVRPPFRVVWSDAVGGLMEFPAVVSDGVAFVTNFSGGIRAF
jgi:hypothetical protein